MSWVALLLIEAERFRFEGETSVHVIKRKFLGISSGTVMSRLAIKRKYKIQLNKPMKIKMSLKYCNATE